MCIGALMILGLSAGVVRAQEITATVSGVVADPSGAAVPGAKVTATDTLRGATWTTESNGEGIYRLPRLPVGKYTLKVEAAGFRSVVHPEFTLELNQVARIDIQLKLGTVTQAVEVTAAPPLLQTTNAQVGSVISSNTNVNLPLSTRNFIELTGLAPGVVLTTNPASMTSGQRTGGGGRPYVNGNRKEANNFLLDGMDNNQISDNLTSYQPNVDAIQEFNMITNNASAEFGDFQGGVINVAIKSGTNDMHGGVFEFLRNDVLNANNWARDWQGLRKPAMRWNMFGGTIGGPIKKDTAWYFGDVQVQRFDFPPVVNSFSVVPTAFRNGDFSAICSTYDAAGACTDTKGRQLYNPFQLDASGNRVPFAFNKIPSGLMDTVAKNLFGSSLYPQPTLSGLQFNSTNTTHSAINTSQFDIRTDFRRSERDNISVRSSTSWQRSPGFNSFPLAFNTFNNAPFNNEVVNWTRNFSPAIVNEARIGVNRILLHNGGLDKGGGNIAQTLGIQNGNDRGPGLLSLQFTNGFASFIGSSNIGTQQQFADTTGEVEDNLLITRGRHMMKTGAQILREDINTFYAGNNGRTGFIQFNGQFTAGPNPGKPSSIGKGLSEGDFFLGLPSRLARGVNTGTWGQRSTVLGVYFQDDWRKTNNLTLNLGLRWQYFQPWYEVHDRQANFAPISGTLLLAGQNGNSRALYNGYNRDWEPRVGFAWTPGRMGGKTVLRGAYTISSFLEGTGTNLRLPLNPPFNFEFETIYDGKSLPPSTTDQGLTVLTSPSNPFSGANIRLWNPTDVQPAVVEQWNFSGERQFPYDTTLTVGYVGQHGTHLMVPMPYFQKQLLANGTTLPSPYLSGNPQLASIAQISGTESDGRQIYHALQTSLRKRQSRGLEYSISYTWSKGMSDAIGYYGEGGQAASQSAYWQYLYNGHAEWGPTYFDATHLVSAFYVYQLPFGRGKKFGSGWNSVLDKVFGNWQSSGILIYHTGFPLTVRATDLSGTISRGARGNCIGPAHILGQVGPGTTWFDTSAYSQPSKGTLGSCGNGTLRGPGLTSFDFGLQKDITITESKKLQFRSEFVNLTNTPFFSSPTMSVVSVNFGRVLGSQGERNIQFALKLYF